MFFDCSDVFGSIVLNTNPLNAIPLNEIPLKWVSMNNQECKIIAEIINVSRNEPSFYSKY